MKALLTALLLVSLFACDDGGGPNPEPQPEPEPEPPATVPMVAETHTFGADDALLFRDEYIHRDGQLSGIFRSGPDGRTAAVWVPERDETGRLTRIAVGLAQEHFFAYDELRYDEHSLQGLFQSDDEGATAAALLFDYTPAGTLKAMRVQDGPDPIHTDRFGYADGTLNQIMRLGPNDEVLAAMTIISGTEGEMTRIDVSAPSGQAYVVEYTYDAEARIEPGPLGLMLLYPLTRADGSPLPLLSAPR